MKKIWWFFIIVVLSLLISFLAFSIRYVSFSETHGKVKDTEGNPIAKIKVIMSSFCSSGHYSTESNIKETTTDNNGNFEFSSFKIKSNLPSRKCEKVTKVSKKGYCAYSSRISYITCTRELSEINFSFSDIDPYYFQDSITINSKDKEVVHILKDISSGIGQEELKDLEKELSKTSLTDLPKN